jgi:hypothetical protein
LKLIHSQIGDTPLISDKELDAAYAVFKQIRRQKEADKTLFNTLTAKQKLDVLVVEGQVILAGCLAASDQDPEKTRSCDLISTSRVALRKQAKEIRDIVEGKRQ